MFLDDLAQLWGHAQGLPQIRVGMTVGEARAALGGTMIGGDLSFVVGDPVRRESPVALHGNVRAWRQIDLRADAQWDLDGGFWSASSLVAEYLAGEMGAPAPRHAVGRRGQKLLRLRHRGAVDGVPVEIRFAADGLTEDGISMELSILPDRPWTDLIGDALAVGSALSSLLPTPAIPAGGTCSLPTELDGSHVEVLHAVDGALRVRISEGRCAGAERPLASMALTSAAELLRRKSARQEEVDGLGFACTVYRGLAGPEGRFEVRLSRRPAKGVEGELVIRAEP